METKTPIGAYYLNLQKGITNIGSNPDNDIVINDPRVQPFHLIIDHRRKPYKVIALSPDSRISINGVAIAGNDPIEVKDLNQVRFNGFAMRMDPGNETNGQIEIEAPAADYQPIPEAVMPAAASVAMAVEANALSNQEPVSTVTAKPMSFAPAIKDDIILVSLLESKAQTNVEQPAVYRLSVINAGPIVATFEIQVAGVPQEWVRVLPARLNLNENGRGQAEVQILAPRDPSSIANRYPLQFSVSSPNYPDHLGQADAEFELNSYHLFSLGNLEPKMRSASYRKKAGMVTFPLTNLGNSASNYQVSAADDENGLQFEFPQEDQTRLLRQSELRIEPGQTKSIPMVIRPLRRQVFRMRGKQYPYTVRAQEADKEGSQLVSGTFTSQPLLGFFTLVMMAVLVAFMAYFLMRPRIYEFTAAKEVIERGQSVSLHWKVSFFTSDMHIEGIDGTVKGSQNQVTTTPTETATTYTLVASNWLWRTLRMPDLRSDPVTVLMIPATPSISTFSVDNKLAYVGDTVNTKWSISNADQAFLTVDGVTTTLDQEKFNGELPVTLSKDTLLVLEAKNSAGSQVRSQYLIAQEPTIKIEEFSLSKTTITLGDPVTIKWKVSGIGVESVKISPFEEDLPLSGELTFYPKESMEFVMSVKNRDLEEIRLLPVGVQPPGTPPEAPVISFFKAAPQEMVGAGSTEFSWSVSGQTDKIEVTDSDGVVAGSLPAQGFASIDVKSTTNYVLTAYNKTASASSILEVKVNPDLMQTEVKINSTIPSASLMRGDSMQVYFSVRPFVDGKVITDVIAAKLPELSGKVVVTDGYDTCEAELPKTSCLLTINTSSPDKKLTATYSGDNHYARRTSDPYPEDGSLVVMGTPATFVGQPSFSANNIVPGQLTKLSFTLGPADIAKLDPVSGEVRVYLVEDGVEAADPICRVNLGGVVGAPNQGQGSCDLSFITAGEKVLRIKYMGNTVYDGVIATSLTDFDSLQVVRGSTEVTFLNDLSTSTVTGQTQTVQVRVRATGGAAGIPTGNVSISVSVNGNVVQDAASKCTATLTNGTGSCTLRFLNRGDYTVLAQYISDLNFEGSSNTANHPVAEAPTQTVFTQTPPVTKVGQSITFSLQSTVSAPGAGTLTGTAWVVDAGLAPGSPGYLVCEVPNVNNGAGTCSHTLLSTATKVYKVIYDPIGAAVQDSNFSSSESETFTYTPQRSGTIINTFTADRYDGTLLPVNNTAIYTVSVITDPSSSVLPQGTVRVSADTYEFCDIDYPAETSCSLTYNSAGPRNITAVFLGNADYAGSTFNGTLSYTIKKNATITSVTPDPSTGLIDQLVVFDVQVTTDPEVTDNPTGTVRVTVDGTYQCTVTLGKDENGDPVTPTNIGACSITFTKSMKDVDLRAEYSGDSLFVSSSRLDLKFTVSKAQTTTTITDVSKTTIIPGETITVYFKVNKQVTDPNQYNSLPQGKVIVSSNASTTDTCEGTLVAGTDSSTGQCDLVLKTPGSQSLTGEFIEKLGDDRYAGSTSIPFSNILVGKATTYLTFDFTDPVPPYENLTSFVHGQKIRVAFTVDSAQTPLTPTSRQVTVSADNAATGETCMTYSSSSDGTGACEITVYRPTDNKRTITVSYPGSDSFEAASDDQEIIVDRADANLSIVNLPTDIYVGTPYTYTIKASPVAPSTAIPTGTPTLTASKGSITVNGTNCTALDSTGSGTCDLTLQQAGTWTFSASLAQTSGFNAAEFQQNLSVKKDPTTTTVSVSTASPVVGSQVSFTVKVVAAHSTTVSLPNNILPTVTLTPPASSTNTASCATASFAFNPTASLTQTCTFTPDEPGTWKINVNYAGNDDFGQSSNGSGTLVKVKQTVTLSDADTNQTYILPGLPWDLTINLSGSVSSIPVNEGTLTLKNPTYNGGTANPLWFTDSLPSNSVSNGTSSFSDLPSPENSETGEYTFRLEYSGSDNYEPATLEIDRTLEKITWSLVDVYKATYTAPEPEQDFLEARISMDFDFPFTENSYLTIFFYNNGIYPPPFHSPPLYIYQLYYFKKDNMQYTFRKEWNTQMDGLLGNIYIVEIDHSNSLPASAVYNTSGFFNNVKIVQKTFSGD